ncbi:unnamed protein product [Ectocarpus sp. CCAP 1310/34]|nr:unnamed protein product [Ectocarpus sp. CCAP 1310/34]
MAQLGNVFREYHDVFSSSPTDFGSCSLVPYKLTVPPGSAPVTSRPYRVNPPVAKQVDAILDQYLAAGLIQRSTSRYSRPLVVIPKKSGGVRITVNYRKLNKLCALSQLPISQVDDTLDKLLKGRIYSLLDTKSSFHQITVHRDTTPLTAFVTSSGLFEWLKMPQGSSTAPGWFCKVVNEVIRTVRGAASYLDDLIVFDDTPANHVGTMRALFERLRTHSLKLTPPKATIGATEADFLGHTISPDGVRPNGAKVSALTKMPMPEDVKQLRSLLDGLSYYRKFLPNMAKRIRYLTTLLKKQENFVFTLSMEQAVRVFLAELANPPVLVYPDWDAVSDASRPFHPYCDASRDGFGETLEQEQPDGFVCSIVFISRATLDSERHWTPRDLEAGSIVWSESAAGEAAAAAAKVADLQRRVEETEERSSAEDATRDRVDDAGYTAGNLRMDGAGYAPGYIRDGAAGGAATFGARGAATFLQDDRMQRRDRKPPVYDGNFPLFKRVFEAFLSCEVFGAWEAAHEFCLPMSDPEKQALKLSLTNMKMKLGEEPRDYFLRFHKVLSTIRAVNGDEVTDREVLAMLRRNLLADYDQLKPLLMHNRALTRSSLETLVRSHHVEQDLGNGV